MEEAKRMDGDACLASHLQTGPGPRGGAVFWAFSGSPLCLGFSEPASGTRLPQKEEVVWP